MSEEIEAPNIDKSDEGQSKVTKNASAKENIIYEVIHKMIRSENNINNASIASVAEKFGVSRQAIHHLIKEQTISAVRLAEFAHSCGFDMVFVPKRGRGLMSVRDSLIERSMCEACPSRVFARDFPEEVSEGIIDLGKLLTDLVVRYNIESARLISGIMESAPTKK